VKAKDFLTDVMLTTKFSAPALRSPIVERARLIDRIRPGIQRRLTLVTAPTGYGKTTLLGGWRTYLNKIGWPVAWLSLDKDDDEPTRFWSYVIAALRTINPEWFLDTLSMEESGDSGPSHQALTMLINQISSAPSGFSLILDDYHVIQTESIDLQLNYLITHMPEPMRLVIGSRATPRLPIAELRAKNQLCEIRARDLSFTTIESQTYFQGIMGLDLTTDVVRRLVSKTEGWIAGLQLAALSMKEGGDVERFVTRFDGGQRHVYDYLLDAVLVHLSPEVQEFLVKTSILAEVTTPLCDYLLEIHNSRQILDDLELSTLFIVPLDEQHRWYRYQALFADFLGMTLQHRYPLEISQLHRRACCWLKDNGFPGKAVRHAIAANEHELAATIIETRFLQAETQFDYLDARHCFTLLPYDLIRQRPRLALYYALMGITVGRKDNVERLLHDVTEALDCPADIGLSAREKHHLRPIWLAVRAAYECARENFPLGISMATHALKDLPQDDGDLYAWLCEHLGYAYASVGNLDAAVAAFAQQANFAADHHLPKAQVYALCDQARVQHMQGRLREAEARYLHALELAQASDLASEFRVFAEAGLAGVAIERNDLQAAALWLRPAREYLATADLSLVNWSFAVWVCSCLAWHSLLQGDLKQAKDFIKKACSKLGDQPVFGSLYGAYIDIQVQIYLADGDLVAAEQWARGRMSTLEQGAQLTLAEGLALARVLIAIGRPAEASSQLTQMEARARDTGCLMHLLRLMALNAQALDISGEHTKAVEVLAHALALGQPEGYLRMFLDGGDVLRRLVPEAIAYAHWASDCATLVQDAAYLERLLSAFGSVSHPVHPQAPVEKGALRVLSPLIEPLSQRESEVLALLVAGRSTGQVAHELVISTETAKVHIRNIYQKLGVHSRPEAIDFAIRLNLLSPSNNE